MRWEYKDNRLAAIGDDDFIVYLSRRNLLALLAKLDGHPKGSQCSIIRDSLQVIAEEDDEHYKERKPGKMHAETERKIKEMKRGKQE